MKTKLYLAGIVLTLLAVFAVIFSPASTLLSPISFAPHTSYSIPHTPYIILGFAPYWNLKKLTPDSLKNITHFAYFHLLLNSGGGIYTKVSRYAEDPGYTNYKRLVAGSINYGDKPLIITFMPESQSALTSIISSPQARQKTLDTISKVLAESGATGVNIDFEPTGDIPPSVRDNFSLFIKELRSSLTSDVSHLTSILTISIYPSAASKPRIWDLASLAPFTDYFVVMTYDYAMPTDSSAGPNAPLRGAGILFDNDIIKNVSQLTSLIPSNKILLGIPFYGYEWTTDSEVKYAPSTARAVVASLERIQTLLDNQTFNLLWDRNSLTPYGVATISGQTSQFYFENETSISLKIEFVKSANLGGIAIWALGYEGNTPWLWPTIQKLRQ